MEKEPKLIVRRMGLDEARKRRKELVFVDARSATALARNPWRISGAIDLPLKRLEESVKELPTNCALVTYCT